MNLEALCKEVNLELYDSELTSENGKKIYRVYVMKPLDEKGERRGVIWMIVQGLVKFYHLFSMWNHL